MDQPSTLGTSAQAPLHAPAPAAGRGRGDGVLIVTLFFFSGAAGLIYEVLWGRMLGLEMGNTAYSLATILTVFMGGLALGSWIGGRLAHRVRNGLRVYGWMEIGIGLFCLALPHLIEALHPPMQWVYRNYYGSQALFSLLQFLLCGAVLLVPVTLMGATLPVVAEHVTRRRERLAGSVGLIYAVNTAGAFVGCMLAGMWLVTELGVSTTNFIAAGINLAVGAIAVLLASRAAPTAHLAEAPAPASELATPDASEGSQASGIPIPVLLGGFGLSGFAAMAYQVAWTRTITMSIGSATYAFTLIVGAFILGLALGSAVLGALGENRRLTAPLLISTQLLLVAFAWIVVQQLGDMPAWSAALVYEHAPDAKLPSDAAAVFQEIQLATFGKLFLMVLPSTFVMGGTLPLVCKEISRRAPRSGVGAILGRAYASNTVGTILGSFMAGFVLIPLVGMRGTIVGAMFLNLVVGLTWLGHSGVWPSTVRPLARVSTSGLAALGLVLMVTLHVLVGRGDIKAKELERPLPKWDSSVWTSAPYIDGHLTIKAMRELKRAEGTPLKTPAEDWREYMQDRYQVLEIKEDVATTVTISKDRLQNEPELRVGGKVDAKEYDSAQAMLAHLPLILHPNPEDMLIVGLGSGGTLKSSLQHESIQSVQDVEISGAVVELSERWFNRIEPFRDPRAEIIVGDGRQHVAMTDRRYDVIVSQPSNPWIVGASSLFTADCFEEMKARLKPGGVVCIWMQGFQVGPEPVRTLLKTFSSVFEHIDLWENLTREEYFLTGYVEPLEIDPQRVEDRIRDPRIAEEMKMLYIESAADLLGHYIGDRAALEPFIADAEISTDDHNLLEAQIPKDLLLVSSTKLAKLLLDFREPVTERVALSPDAPIAESFQKKALDIFASHPIAVDVFIGLRDESVVRYELLQQLYNLNPNDLHSKNFAAGVEGELEQVARAMHGFYTNEVQAVANEGVERRCMAAMTINSHRLMHRYVYWQEGPAETPHAPEAQWIWHLYYDVHEGAGRIMGEVLDLPGNAAAHASPWRNEHPLAGIGPGNLVTRTGCGLVFITTQQGFYGVNVSPADCPQRTEFMLMPSNPQMQLPQRLNYWQRPLDETGQPLPEPAAPTEFRLLTKDLPL